MTAPEPENGSESEDGEVDLFAELGVESPPVTGNAGDGLEAFMDDDEDDTPVESAPAGIEHHEEEDAGDDEDDLFATLGVAGPSVSLVSSVEEDILAAFMDDEEESPEEVEEPTENTPTAAKPDAKEAYRMVLETVWVDGILDPGEVHLLAKRRSELDISFEEHLDLVREMLG